MISVQPVRGREAQAQLEEEAVELGLGQRVGTLLLQRVLRGEHVEGLLQGMGLSARRDAVLLHRLEQRRLGLGRRAVDLVGHIAGLQAHDGRPGRPARQHPGEVGDLQGSPCVGGHRLQARGAEPEQA